MILNFILFSNEVGQMQCATDFLTGIVIKLIKRLTNYLNSNISKIYNFLTT